MTDAERRLRGGLDGSTYTAVTDGLIWETYVGDDRVIQCPQPGEESLIPRTAFLHDHLTSHGARVPSVIAADATPPAYLLVERVGHAQLSAIDPETDRWLDAIRETGAVLAGVHDAPGFGYGEIDGPAYEDPSHDDWRRYAVDQRDLALDQTDGTHFESLARTVADEFDPACVPRTPESAVLQQFEAKAHRFRGGMKPTLGKTLNTGVSVGCDTESEVRIRTLRGGR